MGTPFKPTESQIKRLNQRLQAENASLKRALKGLPLYEKLWSENNSFRNVQYNHDTYISEWKERFGYDDSVSFDVILQDLLKLKRPQDDVDLLHRDHQELLLSQSSALATINRLLMGMKELLEGMGCSPLENEDYVDAVAYLSSANIKTEKYYE